MTVAAQAHLDQAHAAARHAASAVTRIAAERGTPIFEGFNVPWIRHQVTQFLCALASDQAELCPHLRDNTSPQVVHGAAWRPRALFCSPCAATELVPDPANDDQCDRCGRHVPDLHSSAVAIGAVLFGFGLCPRCSKVVGIKAPPAARRPRPRAGRSRRQGKRR
jgi:hypothetical protein